MPAKKAVGFLTVVAAAALAASFPAQSAPVTVEYPSIDCPDTGDDGLQLCIDGADPGSTVILTAEIIDEGAIIDKSLTLRAADRSLQPHLIGLLVSSTNAPVHVVIEDIRLSLGMIVIFQKGKGHSVVIRRIDVGRDAIEPVGVRLDTSRPASFTLEDSVIRSDQEDQQDVLNLSSNDPNGLVSYRIVGNQISARNDTDSAAGIELSMEGEGTVHADIYNNVVSDVATCNCGAQSGLAILPDRKTRAVVNVVGNTFVNIGSSGIQQRNGMTSGRLTLNVFNNIFSNLELTGLSLDAGRPGTLVFRGGYNDFFDVQPGGFDGQGAGPGNLKLDPRFQNPAKRDFRLRANSPLINKGLTCSPGGVANPDAAGRHRLQGRSVDMGAFERNAPPVTGDVKLGTNGDDTLNGTSGRDILCGFAGADTLRGRDGPDFIDGGPGPDIAVGGGGFDRVLGNTGDDTLCTRDGESGDVADGGPGADRGKTDVGDTRISIESNAGC